MQEKNSLWIEKVTIKNFRSIEHLPIEFNADLNTLVGPNDAGKSNILDAINIVLGDVYLPYFKPQTDDFYKGDDTKEISIQLVLRGELIHQFGERYYNFIDKETNRMAIRYRYKKPTGVLEIWQPGKLGRWIAPGKRFIYYYGLNDNVEFCYIRAIRDIEEHTPTRWKSPFKQLREMLEEEMELDPGLSDLTTKLDEINSKLSQAPSFQKFQHDLEKIAKKQTNFKSVSFGISSHTKSDLLKNLQIFIDDGYKSLVGTKGTGSQNAIIIALYRILAERLKEKENKILIYGFEEPEIGLHPHGQRQFLESVKNLSDSFQVFVSTHSPNFIDSFNLASIIRINKEDDKTKNYPFKIEVEERRNLETRLFFEVKELFFSKKILLVDGYTELGYFPYASKYISIKKENGEKENVDFDRLNISVLHVSGDAVSFIKMIQILNLPYFCVLDKDNLFKESARENLLNKLEQASIIDNPTKEKINSLASSGQIEVLNKELDSINCVVLPSGAFEKEALAIENDDYYKRIYDELIIVLRSWGKDRSLISIEEFNNKPLFKKKAFLFDLLRANKKQRVALAVARAIKDESQISDTYKRIIMKIASL